MPCRKARLVTMGVAVCCALVAFASPGAARGQDAHAEGASLQELYTSALEFQKAGDLDRAAGQYRKFLAAALDELANRASWAGEPAKASSLFEEALQLDPDSPSLQNDYATAEMRAGRLEHAETLARTLLNRDSNGARTQAQAHQLLGLTLLKMNRDKEARKELEAAVALDPSFTNQYDLAVACLDVDDEPCATQIFDKLKEAAGDTAALHMTFGRAYGSSDFAPRAIAEFKTAIAENPRQPGARYCLAAAMLATGGDEATVQAAVEELKKELALSPDDFLTYAALGKIAATRLQYAEAERYLKRAIALNPRSPDAYLYLGQMEFDTRDYADAEPALRKAIELTTDPGRNRYQIQKAHYLLGRILMQQHHEEQAHAEMQTARDLANKVLSNDKNELAGMLAGASDGADAGVAGADSAAAPPAPATDPDSLHAYDELAKQLTAPVADCYNNLGAIAASGSDFTHALAYFARADAWNPHLDGLDYNLGHAAFMASHFSQAVSPLTHYLAAHPGDSGIRDALAISQFMTGDYSGCVTTLKRVANLPEDIPQVQFVYADSLVKMGQVAAGKQRLQAIAAAHPEIPDVHRGLGEAFAREGQTQDARRELEAAARLNAADPETRSDLASLDLKEGDTAGAIGELQSATALRPDDPDLHRQLAHAYTLAFRVADAEKEMAICQKLQASHKAEDGSAQPSGENIR